MRYIKLKDYCADFPIYNSQSRSLKLNVMKRVTGGRIASSDSGIVVIRALHNINLEINEGDRIAFVGHNGAGKSTMLRALMGIYEPSSGTREAKGKIGSLIDINLGADPEATGRRNIFLRGTIMGLSKSEILKRTPEIIEFSGLGEYIDLPMRTYSTGMQMRLSFATATAVQPEILLMDEWMSVGDADFAHQADKRLRKLVDDSKILGIATHSKETMLSLCTRAVWLEQGEIKMMGTAQDVAEVYFH